MRTKHDFLQITAVGDKCTDKSKLLLQFSLKNTFQVYRPTQLDFYDTKVKINDNELNIRIVDTPEEDRTDKFRKISLFEANVVLLFFSLVDKQSLENISIVYLPEIRYVCPQTPLILVGTKSKLRDKIIENPELEKPSQKPISNKDIKRLSKTLRLNGYFECDVDEYLNIDELFDSAIKTAIVPSKSSKCSVS